MIAEGDAAGVRLLLGLLDGGTGPVYGRLGLAAKDVAPGRDDPRAAARVLDKSGAPASVILWMLETDRPALRVAAFYAAATPLPQRRDILLGRSFAPDAAEAAPMPVPKELEYWRRSPEYRDLAQVGDVLAALYAARTMEQGRAAANAVVAEDWPQVAAADRDEPLPGYSRWNLAVRLDCPVGLRAQFGDHAKFRHRLRQAGVVSGPAEYVEGWRPARQVLSVLALGTWAFPTRLEEARDVLRPLVQGLGFEPEPWAVLAQLLPTFSGTLPELLTTTRAVSGV